MAHDITHANGRYEFAWTGEAPWHNLGQRLPAAATSEDILKAAGLEWMVLTDSLHLSDGTLVPGFVANRRSDTKEVLGIVSNDYKVVQNGDALRFADSLVEEAMAIFHTAGSLSRGKRIFATAKLPTDLLIVPGDVVEQYLLIVNAHDGTQAMHLRFTPVRVVCANTLGAAMHGRASWQYTIRHVGDLKANVAEAKRALGIASRYFDEAGEKFTALAEVALDGKAFDTFLDDMQLPQYVKAHTSGLDDERLGVKVGAMKESIKLLAAQGLGSDIPGVKGTAWGAFNAVVEFIERVRTAKKDGGLRKNAIEASIIGAPAQDLRQRGLDAALRAAGLLSKDDLARARR